MFNYFVSQNLNINRYLFSIKKKINCYTKKYKLFKLPTNNYDID